MASQYASRPAPKAETTPIPVIATRGWVTNGLPIIANVTELFRWSGALLFLLSLLSFAVVYGWRLRTPAPPSDNARDAIANVILFSVFALHHSVMARTGAKAWLTRLIPPQLERSVYVWIASLLFLGVCWMWQPLPGVVWQTRGPGIVLYIAQAFGVALTIAAARIVGIWELAGVTQPDPAKPIEFRAEGPFAIVRHPIYLGWVLMVFATPIMTTSQMLFAVISTAYLVAAIPLEERSLVEAFGEKYAAYQRQMKWRLIPFIW
jgi:protein-S-isoprenylcysteine O-methyltransferase Ste14